MIGWLKKIIFILFIILIVTFVVINNQTNTNLTFWPNKVIEAGLGIVIITSFLVGFFIASLIGSYISLKSYIKELQLKRKNNKCENINEKITQARIYTCLKEDTKAIKLWEELKKTKALTVPYIELAKIFLSQENFNLALGTLKEGIKIFPHNEELIFYLAKTHEILGNDASCLENYARIFDTKPCITIAILARDEAIKIKQYDDALEYQKNINLLTKDKNNIDDKKTDIEFLKILKETPKESIERKQALESLHQSTPSHTETALELSEILLHDNKAQEAVQVLTKLALNIKKTFVWNEIVDIWIKANEPKKVVSTINTMLKENVFPELLKSYFLAIKTCMKLSMLDDAREYFEKMINEIKEKNFKLEKNEQILIDILYSILLNNKNFKNLDFFNIIDK